MKILLLSDAYPPDGLGGDSAVVANLAREYKKHGHDVFVISTTKCADYVGRKEWQGIPIERIEFQTGIRLRSWFSLYNPRAVKIVGKIVREFRPDIVHAHSLSNQLSFYSLVVSARYGAKVFLTLHDAMLFHYGKALDENKVNQLILLKHFKFDYIPFRSLFIKRILKSVTGIVSVSNALAHAHHANGIRVHSVVRNGIDVNEWQVRKETVENLRTKLHLGNKVILFGGRLSGLKGAFVAVEALAEVVKRVTDAQLLVIGIENDTAKKMRKIASVLSVEKSLIFSGFLSGSELAAAYHAADVVVVPSLYLDPLPTINLEAYACEKPVVATKHGGSKEIVVDGETGFIVEPSDIAELSIRLQELLLNPDMSRKLGAAGLARIREEFTLERQAAAYERLFDAA